MQSMIKLTRGRGNKKPTKVTLIKPRTILILLAIVLVMILYMVFPKFVGKKLVAYHPVLDFSKEPSGRKDFLNHP